MKEIQIGGLVSFTTIDYPGKLAGVVFLVGCPLRCAYCSNSHLLDVRDGEYDPQKVFDWIKSRVGKLEAIVFSGGEALMQGDALLEYMQRVKNLGFNIGLHTNGFYPETLQKASQFIDWIGLDFKAVNKDKYKELTGFDLAYQHMLKSLDIWLQTGKDMEVRMTCDPRYISKQDLLQIAHELHDKKVPKIAIQKYIPYKEEKDCPTTADERAQFFTDEKLKEEINSLFESVTWRE